MKGKNATVTQLLNLRHVRDVLANADALKACPDRSFDLIEEHCMDDNLPKKFISICTNGSLTNIGFNDNLFTHIAEEHSHSIHFWCIIHQLELAIK